MGSKGSQSLWNLSAIADGVILLVQKLLRNFIYVISFISKINGSTQDLSDGGPKTVKCVRRVVVTAANTKDRNTVSVVVYSTISGEMAEPGLLH